MFWQQEITLTIKNKDKLTEKKNYNETIAKKIDI